uniref:Uncharacterized protein n=1 Tax=Physcomitrium patens TaxID=3218 RepID=A0A2K1IMV3_PHYPA|nr:hypothetical protein PHYPA_026920 [Physcomitrium patens]
MVKIGRDFKHALQALENKHVSGTACNQLWWESGVSRLELRVANLGIVKLLLLFYIARSSWTLGS